MRTRVDIGRNVVRTDAEEGEDWMSGHIELDDLSLNEAEGERYDVYLFDDEAEYPRWLYHSSHLSHDGALAAIERLADVGITAVFEADIFPDVDEERGEF